MQVIFGTFAFQVAGGGSATILMLVVMLGLMYLIVIRPQQVRQKKWQKVLGELKTGDRVVTGGGIRGTIVALREDFVHLRVPPDNIRLEVQRASIVSVIPTEGEAVVAK